MRLVQRWPGKCRALTFLLCAPGDGLLFWTRHPNGTDDQRSVHHHLPSRHGTKWAAIAFGHAQPIKVPAHALRPESLSALRCMRVDEALVRAHRSGIKMQCALCTAAYHIAHAGHGAELQAQRCC